MSMGPLVAIALYVESFLIIYLTFSLVTPRSRVLWHHLMPFSKGAILVIFDQY